MLTQSNVLASIKTNLKIFIGRLKIKDLDIRIINSDRLYFNFAFINNTNYFFYPLINNEEADAENDLLQEIILTNKTKIANLQLNYFSNYKEEIINIFSDKHNDC